MKVRMQCNVDGHKVEETLEAPTIEELVVKLRDRVAKELGWKGVLLKTLTPLQFTQEAVRRYNEAHAKNEPPPQSLEEFVQFGKRTGYLTVLEQ